MSRQSTVATIETIAEEVTAAAGVELVEVELKGSGRNHLLRVYIDKPDGVTHGDCQLVSDLISEKLDAGNIIEGQYTLEISSPGVERKLKKAKDFERFVGQPVKIFLKEPLAGKRFFEGELKTFADQTVTLDVSGHGDVAIPFEQIDRANLKFHW
ncbi:MAG TPA: ribosome maturation factor [Solibacterales bacterium]|nr:ribosome maturation factor [Bryobacterales bacterium]